ncbi:hypothetical protein FQN57_001542 [Myotisia sp. PD_48]|nr:hypothetical protein FQN57_001542 [Myotisia sp. PD_48]
MAVFQRPPQSNAAIPIVDPSNNPIPNPNPNTNSNPNPNPNSNSSNSLGINSNGTLHRHQPRWNPNIYANPYTPHYLLAVNWSPAIDYYSTPLKTIDYNAYVQQFAGNRILKPTIQPEMPLIRSVPVSISLHDRNLSPASYLYYFDECLLLEAYQHSRNLLQLNLYNVPVTPVEPAQNLFELRVPGLRDDAPSLDLGDTLLLRQIFHFPQLACRGAEWLAHNSNSLTGSIAPGFNGHQLHAIVVGISRAKELVRLRIDRFLQASWTVNILFKIQPSQYVPLWEALTKINTGSSWPPPDSVYGPSSAGITSDTNWYRHMLFPEEHHATIQSTLPQGAFPHAWTDTDLNYEQMKAVDSIISRNYGDIPFLISGVPGSGKTKTVVECTLQLLNCPSDVEPHILLCAPSNPAADTLAIRLASHLHPRELFRLNGSDRTFAEVPGALLPFSYSENDIFSLPKFQTVLNYKVIVTTCKDANMLVRARLTNRDLLKLSCETLSILSRKPLLQPQLLLHWTALLVDEAAQATEPTVCVPLTVVATPFPIKESPDRTSKFPLFIMAGDHHQLGPRLHNLETALSTSLFERISSRPVYAHHPLSRRNAGPYKKLTQEMLPIPRPAFTNLTRNYRSHPAILAVPSILFYSDTLIPSAPTIDPNGPIPTWPEWKLPHRWPVLFSCNTSLDDVEEILHRPTGNGLFNPGEALLALYYVKSLLGHSNSVYAKAVINNSTTHNTPPVAQEDIAIISPFRSQVAHLRKLFRAHSLHSVNIGPLEAFQGLETRFLIICTTRTRTDLAFIKQDHTLGLGLVGEKKRFNVALTRSREGVVVLGNPNVLVDTGKDESWRTFLSFCARNACWAPEDHAKVEMYNTAPNNSTLLYEEDSANTYKSARWWAKKLAGIKVSEIQDETCGTDNRNGSLSSEEEASCGDDEMDVRLSGYVSRLERALLYQESVHTTDFKEDGSLPTDDEFSLPEAHTRSTKFAQQQNNDYDLAMWTAGIAAEEVLKDLGDY